LICEHDYIIAYFYMQALKSNFQFFICKSFVNRKNY
jgi:hypothetical protein